MSKAFTKEDSGNDLDDDSLELESEEEKKFQGFKNYITPPGAETMKAELHQLLVEARPEIVRTVAWAASNGDRSENGDYIYGKRKLREIDRRIRFLQKRLEIAEIVDPSLIKADRVLFGANVTVETESGEVKKYCIVGVDETEVSKGRISWISPVAKALLNAKVGDTVTVRTPKSGPEGEEWVVLSIHY